jgi:hypothetical protein
MNDEYFCALEVSRTQAIVKRDLEAIERFHAPGYELITPAGRVFTRERYLAAIASEPFYAAWEHREMRVRRSASMAVVRYQAILTFPSGKVVECWHTDTYELVGESWQAVWSQATQLPQPSAKQ